jgi:transcriptional regulator with XRE-family HTH domain
MFSTVQCVDEVMSPVTKPEPPPEAVIVRLAREAAHIRTEDAARAAGISKARWSQVETGYESRLGIRRPVVARAVTLAHMARAVGVSPARLRAEGHRPDAADILEEILRREQPAPEPPPPAVIAELWGDLAHSPEIVQRLWRAPLPEEARLELIESYIRQLPGMNGGNPGVERKQA